MSSDYQSNIEHALQSASAAACSAGKLLLERLNDERVIQVKGYRDLVTDADLSAEALIKERLQAELPEYGFIAEETASAPPLNNGFVWVIDPLDGTTNYSQRFPTFAVSIALLHEGHVQVGVVYDPSRDHLFQAALGRGSQLNGKPIFAGSAPNLSDAVVGLDWGRKAWVREGLKGILPSLLERAESLRSGGATALGPCYVAAGWLDAYFHVAPSLWDVAACALIARESGAQVTDFAGNTWQPDSSTNILAANSMVHDELLPLLNPPAQS